MAQISLYVDDETMKKIVKKAKKEKMSISKWVKEKIERELKNIERKEYIESFYGSIADATFVRPDQGNLDDDAKRLEL